MKALDSTDLLWGMLCCAEHRRFPLDALVDFFWERRGKICGRPWRFGTTQRHIERELVQSFDFAEMGGLVEPETEPGGRVIILRPAGCTKRRRLLTAQGVYANHGDELRKLARDFDAHVAAADDRAHA